MSTAQTVADSPAGRGTEGPVTLRLAELGRAVLDRGLSAAETAACTRTIVDWFGATIAGSTMAPGQRLILATDFGEGGRARLVPSGRSFPVRAAALVNATASHTAELDDIYREGIYHPGSPTIGAALAVADYLGSSGAQLAAAVAVGYEVGDRIAETVNPEHYRFWHTTGTVGTLGAAAAVAALLELDAPEFAHALATATTMAAGLQQAFRSDAMSKPLHAGHAAEAGVLAARAAQAGYTGALDVLEGEAGFGAAMAGSPDWSATLADPDRALAITRTTVKNHSCCGHTFAAVDAALALRSQGLRSEDIESVKVQTYATAKKVAGNPDPRTPFEAKFSTPYCVASAFEVGSVRLGAFTPEALENQAVRALTARVRVVADEQMEREFPGRRQASVTVLDRAGREHTVHRRTRKGDPDDPLTDDELAEKFVEMSTPVLGEAATGRLAAALWSVADSPDVRQLPLGQG